MFCSRNCAGYTLIEVLFVAGLIAVISGMAVPQVLVTLDRSRGLVAARYLSARMALARTQAVTRGAYVALRFDQTAEGISFSVYQDGNRNGVRTADIEGGMDRRIDPPVRLFEQFPGVEIGIAPGTGLSDPVQIGRSNLLSFSPAGSATSGTIYVRGRDGTQWAVRVLGATGRMRVLRYVARTGEWEHAF
jgi:type II secretory pathway pseudopilin PulG